METGLDLSLTIVYHQLGVSTSLQTTTLQVQKNQPFTIALYQPDTKTHDFHLERKLWYSMSQAILVLSTNYCHIPRCQLLLTTLQTIHTSTVTVNILTLQVLLADNLWWDCCELRHPLVSMHVLWCCISRMHRTDPQLQVSCSYFNWRLQSVLVTQESIATYEYK